MPRNNSADRQIWRKKRARERMQRARFGSEQVAYLDSRLGKNVGAVKERAKLNA